MIASGRISRIGMIAGFALASATPLLSLAVAGLWSARIVDLSSQRLEPFTLSFWATLVLGPLGLLLAVVSGGRRAAMIAAVAPVALTFLELVALLSLSGLGGAPF